MRGWLRAGEGGPRAAGEGGGEGVVDPPRSPGGGGSRGGEPPVWLAAFPGQPGEGGGQEWPERWRRGEIGTGRGTGPGPAVMLRARRAKCLLQCGIVRDDAE